MTHAEQLHGLLLQALECALADGCLDVAENIVSAVENLDRGDGREPRSTASAYRMIARYS